MARGGFCGGRDAVFEVVADGVYLEVSGLL